MPTNGVKSRSRAMSRIALLVLLAAPTFSLAEPRYIFTAQDLTITLHDDVCALKSEVTNLPRRVVWKHKNEIVEGCWGLIEQFGLVSLYFADKTATALPAPLFIKLTNT